MDGQALDVEKYFFRELHPAISIGTASDRYRGWLGQIYSEELYRGRLISRTSRVGKNSFRDEVLPVDCVREYFQHFRILEIDFTFYAPLIEKGGPTPCAKTLGEYSRYLGPEDRVFLKAPQMFFARKVRQGKEYVRNEDYLAPEAFTRQFYEPATRLLGPNLKGIIFEQEYQRMDERVPAEVLAGQFETFFGALPEDDRYHVELRTEAYLSPPVLEVLRSFGVGQVLSHWTWLPNLRRQFAKAGHKFIGAGGQALIRLMTPIGTRYEDAYARAFPFDRLLEDMLQPSMIAHTADLMCRGIEQGTGVNVIVNNRSGGNAPLIAREIVREFQRRMERED